MVDWLKKLLGFFGTERINVQAIGSEWHRIVKQQSLEMRRLRKHILSLERIMESQQREINKLKEELYVLRLKDKIDEHAQQ